MSQHDPREPADTEDRSHDQTVEDKKLEALVTMATGVAHDFNNYLTAIIGNNNIILDRLPQDSRLRLNARQIETTARMALGLTNEIIFYTARAKRNLRLVDIASLVTGMRDELKSIAGKQIPIEYRTEPTCLVRADADQIAMIVRNLAANAIDAMVDRAGEAIEIASGSADCSRERLAESFLGADLAEGRYAFIEVRDKGKGISPEAREQIFDPFFSTKIRGRGMGLPVVVGILRAHGGTISAATYPDEGTVVRVWLPCADNE